MALGRLREEEVRRDILALWQRGWANPATHAQCLPSAGLRVADSGRRQLVSGHCRGRSSWGACGWSHGQIGVMALCARLSPSELPGLPGSERMSAEPGSDGSSSSSSQSSGKKPSRVNHGISCSPLALLLLLLALLLPLARAGDISCQGIRYIYFNKGLDTSSIPRSPQQGGNTAQLFAPSKPGSALK